MLWSLYCPGLCLYHEFYYIGVTECLVHAFVARNSEETSRECAKSQKTAQQFYETLRSKLQLSSKVIQARMKQAKECKVEVRKGKEQKVKAPFKQILGWVFGFALSFIRTWPRHRLVLACKPMTGLSATAINLSVHDKFLEVPFSVVD